MTNMTKFQENFYYRSSLLKDWLRTGLKFYKSFLRSFPDVMRKLSLQWKLCNRFCLNSNLKVRNVLIGCPWLKPGGPEYNPCFNLILWHLLLKWLLVFLCTLIMWFLYFDTTIKSISFNTKSTAYSKFQGTQSTLYLRLSMTHPEKSLMTVLLLNPSHLP